MIWVYKYDENYIWQAGKDILVDVENGEEIPKGYTDKQPPDGLFIAKYYPEKEEWFESATQEYIDSLQPDPPPPDDVALLKKQVALLTLQLSQLQKGGAS
ncbi:MULTISPECIES: hypothetical protein [Bacillus]|uniref:hypothetical protein n=1 Tax=Bacillus TaxID=1386 RepID=UPI00119EE6AE|nr:MULTISPECIES: hypothetical protein [Bacillus]MCM3045219.1 hypothetical protein [Bacillus altitudinis]MEC1801779.1 hypothetical protein [Bacillus altitudinis]